MTGSKICSGELHSAGGGRFLLGRAEKLAPKLVEEYGGGVQLIYLDPPFGTGDIFSFYGGKEQRVTAYSDTLERAQYLEMMETVLYACFHLLSPEGCLYLHIDHRMSAHMRQLLDRIFGEDNFVNEIIWAYKSGGRATRHYSRKHDNILFYRKSRAMYFNISAIGMPRGPEKRNHMKRSVDAAGRVSYSITSGGKTYTYFETTPIYPSDVWEDIEHLHQRDPERTGYATQKPAALLRRMLLASSREGDLVMDLFSGSGTTCDVACELGRRWVATDASPVALLALRERMLKNRGEPTLFSGAQPMKLEYGTEPPILQDFASAAFLSSGCQTTAKLTGFSSPAAPRYMALGRLENGLFHPIVCDFSPGPGSRLSARLPANAAPVVQVCDMAGNINFLQPD